MARATSKIDADRAKLTRTLAGPNGPVIRLVQDSTREVLNAAKLEAPVDTGQLRNSHRSTPITIRAGKISSTVVADKSYATMVHDGTRPHIIRPRTAKALRWKGNRGVVFASVVNHPGTKPNPWLSRAAKRVLTARGFDVTDSR